MQPETQILLLGDLGGWSYLAVFLIALAAGYLVPLPEEVVFVLLGYGAALSDVNILLVILASVLGIIVSDNIAFLLGLKGSGLVDRFKKRIAPEQLAKYEGLIDSHAGKTIFTSRFIPTLRVLVPILAGTMKISWKTFFAYATLAAVIDTGALILLGYVFDQRISSVIATTRETVHILSIVSIIIIGGVVSFFVRTLFFKKNE
ncbi:MAG: DedA family protein [Parcubacteria group bacterium]|jgi:undecaprenyl-diphosphatase